MEEHRKDLKDSKQRKVLDQLMQELVNEHPSFYYLSTTEVAAKLHERIEDATGISHDDLELVKDLSQKDIQMLLSIHH